MSKKVLISIICPTYNEEFFIVKILKFATLALPLSKEFFFIDGGSTDKTREIVRAWSQKHSNIHLLDNPDRYAPFALNRAIPKCKGTYIVRLDAHAEYADDYFERILETFNSVDADVVGGPMRPIGINPFQKAVAHSSSTKFGIGDSNFHNEQYKGYTDSVYLGAWKKDLFAHTGLFDESLIRNQDDEFHYRAKNLGYKIYLNPAIKSWYHPRKNISKLFSQYFQYGLYKPLVLKKVSSEIKLRHLVPGFFVLYLLALPFLVLWHEVFLLPLLLYGLLDLYFSLFNDLPWSVKWRCLLVYPALHLAYGSGFMLGLRKIVPK